MLSPLARTPDIVTLSRVQRVCVFCGSSTGHRPEYARAAQALGRVLAQRHLVLVNGGGHIGLMGVMADAALAAGGQVIGVIPQALVDRELAHRGLTELRVVDSMHARKALMAELSDACIALPGGYGTLDELCEVLTWTQLGLQSKPCGLLNVAGFFDPFLAHVERAMAEGFIRPRDRGLLRVAEEPEDLLDQLTVAADVSRR